jgi:Alw26I/Eco31I/Esp3I family type II restriction endonuclease
MRYGRGKFSHHSAYIAYQQMIVSHPHYAGMPGAVTAEGKPLWQVSSGKTTSFYIYYQARRDWWTAKANTLGLPGRNGDNDRWTIAARLIHPTGYRPCLICGHKKNVGYFYVNKFASKKLSRLAPGFSASPGEPIDAVLERLRKRLRPTEYEGIARTLFSERAKHFSRHGITTTAFERSASLKSLWLSPGFMGNPPYRFDGLHDYCTGCRKGNDPGRADANMRTYNIDRRAFEWWSDGNWAVADALYNLAGPGECQLCVPPKRVRKVSPDHVGPLACGFKQIPFFRPTCRACNSAKNRRMSAEDVALLIQREIDTGETVAGWHARVIWDTLKHSAVDNDKAATLSTYLRGLQDVYLRTLAALLAQGHARLLRTLLRPDYALESYQFEGLNSGTLEYASIKSLPQDTPLRRKRRSRVIRVAFDSLRTYVTKKVTRRRICEPFRTHGKKITSDVLVAASLLEPHSLDEEWRQVVEKILRSTKNAERAIATALAREESGDACDGPNDEGVWCEFRNSVRALCDDISL